MPVEAVEEQRGVINLDAVTELSYLRPEPATLFTTGSVATGATFDAWGSGVTICNVETIPGGYRRGMGGPLYIGQEAAGPLYTFESVLKSAIYDVKVKLPTGYDPGMGHGQALSPPQSKAIAKDRPLVAA